MQTRVGAVGGLAVAIRDAVQRQEPSEALRWVAEFITDVGRAPAGLRGDLLSEEPGPTGSPAWDAVLAGVTEMLAREHGLPVPPWTSTSDRFLTSWWFFSDLPAWRVSAFVSAPAALANRGAFIHADALRSV